MTNRMILLMLATVMVLASGATIKGQRLGSAKGANELGGTSWQLVKFQGSDGSTLAPDDRSKYTITFGADGRTSVRVDCNRGSGTWKYKGENQIQFGAMSIARAKCGSNSLHDRIVREGAAVRNYSIKDGRLFLSLQEEGGTYELEPFRRPPSTRNRQ